MIKKKYANIVKRYNKVMNTIGCEHVTLAPGSEVLNRRDYYGITGKVTIGWLKKEVAYWLECYYDEDNCRCNERHDGKEAYKLWVSETGYLKRLLAALEKYSDDTIIEE